MELDPIRTLAERTLARVNGALDGAQDEISRLSTVLETFAEVAPTFGTAFDPRCADRLSGLAASASQSLASLSQRYAAAAGIIREGDDEAAAMLSGEKPPSAATPSSTAKH